MPYTQHTAIDSFHWLNNDVSNHNEFIRLWDSPRESFDVINSTSEGVSMWKIKESPFIFTIALLSTIDQRVLYYIKCEIWEHINLGKPVTQLKLWRTTHPKYQNITAGLPSKVFNVLLATYNVVASDGVHTYSGKRFWQQELSRAIYKGLFVYRLDLTTRELKQLLDIDKIADNSVDLWGSDEKYMQILGVISKNSLTDNKM